MCGRVNMQGFECLLLSGVIPSFSSIAPLIFGTHTDIALE